MAKSYDFETTDFGEIAFKNNIIQGTTYLEEMTGIPVKYYDRQGNYVQTFDSIVEAYENTDVNNINMIVLALKGMGAFKNRFFLDKNDFCHSFPNGSKDMLWYRSGYDARKVNPDVRPQNPKYLDEWKTSVNAIKNSRFTPEQIMENSPIYYINNDGDIEEWDSVFLFYEHYRLHPVHILEALENVGHLSDRFKYKQDNLAD